MIEKKINAKGNKARVTFELPADAAQESVYVVGDFNDWDKEATPMKHVKGRGVWKAQLSLETGKQYQFRYLIDGTDWHNDEQADGYVQSPFFSENGVLEL